MIYGNKFLNYGINTVTFENASVILENDILNLNSLLFVTETVKFKEIFSNVFDKIKQACLSIANFIKKLIDKALASLEKFALKVVDKIEEYKKNHPTNESTIMTEAEKSGQDFYQLTDNFQKLFRDGFSFDSYDKAMVDQINEMLRVYKTNHNVGELNDKTFKDWQDSAKEKFDDIKKDYNEYLNEKNISTLLDSSSISYNNTLLFDRMNSNNIHFNIDNIRIQDIKTWINECHSFKSYLNDMLGTINHLTKDIETLNNLMDEIDKGTFKATNSPTANENKLLNGQDKGVITFVGDEIRFVCKIKADQIKMITNLTKAISLEMRAVAKRYLYICTKFKLNVQKELYDDVMDDTFFDLNTVDK